MTMSNGIVEACIRPDGDIDLWVRFVPMVESSSPQTERLYLGRFSIDKRYEITNGAVTYTALPPVE